VAKRIGPVALGDVDEDEGCGYGRRQQRGEAVESFLAVDSREAEVPAGGGLYVEGVELADRVLQPARRGRREQRGAA
jgi:hypothetical protein